MRFLLVFLVVLVVAWRWRSWRSSVQRGKDADANRIKTPQTTDMVRCNHCGVHLPVADAVSGALGSYCSAAHRQAREP